MQYKTINVWTVKGHDECERLLARGWVVVRPGMFTVVLRSPRKED